MDWFVEINKTVVTNREIRDAERVLIDNGVDEDEAATVLQALGYTLLDTELFPEEGEAVAEEGTLSDYFNWIKHNGCDGCVYVTHLFKNAKELLRGEAKTPFKFRCDWHEREISPKDGRIGFNCAAKIR